MKEKIKNIAIILIGIISVTSLTVSAATLMKSKDVIYDNTKSGIEATNVQEAVDELYSTATDYSNLSAEIQSLKTTVNTLTTNSFLNAHPVGSIYITISSNENTVTKMHNLYGGTWESYGQGRTLVGVGTSTDSDGQTATYTIGSTGGNNKVSSISIAHTHSVPAHSHNLNGTGFAEIALTIADKAIIMNRVSTSSWTPNIRHIASDSVTTSGTSELGTALIGKTNNSSVLTSGAMSANSTINAQDAYIAVYMYKRVN